MFAFLDHNLFTYYHSQRIMYHSTQWLRLWSTYRLLLHRCRTEIVHKTHNLYLPSGCISRAHFVEACTDQVTTNSPSALEDEDDEEYDN